MPFSCGVHARLLFLCHPIPFIPFLSLLPPSSHQSSLWCLGSWWPPSLGVEELGMVRGCPSFCPVLPMSLLSHRPGVAAEWAEHPAEAVSTSTQWPALACTPSCCSAHRHSCAWALRAAACPRAAISCTAAATEAEPDQPHPETARPGPCGDPAGTRVQVQPVTKSDHRQGQGSHAS